LESSAKQQVQKRHHKQQQQQQELQAADPMIKFMYALKAKESKRQYPRRFKVFLDFLKLEGTMNEQANQFLLNTKNSPQWTEEKFMLTLIRLFGLRLPSSKPILVLFP
jgi:hypothetical protein